VNESTLSLHRESQFLQTALDLSNSEGMFELNIAT
jgi:hypothetical protein